MAIIKDKSKITPFLAGIVVTLAVTGWAGLLITQDSPSVDIPDPQIVDNTNNTQTNDTNITTPNPVVNNTNPTNPTNQTTNPVITPPFSNILPQINITGASFQILRNPNLNPYTGWGYRECFVNCTFISTYDKSVDIVYSLIPNEDSYYKVWIQDNTDTTTLWSHKVTQMGRDAVKVNFSEVAWAKLYIYFVDTETHKYASGVYVVGLNFDGRNIIYDPIKLHTNLESLVGQVGYPL